MSSAVLAKDAGVFINIKSDDVDSVYYTEGVSICRILNRTRHEHNLHCSIVPERYTHEDLSQLEERDNNLFIINRHTWNDVITERGVAPLRTVVNLHNDLFLILVKKSTNLQDLQSLLRGNYAIIVNEDPVTKLLVQNLFYNYRDKAANITYTKDTLADFCSSKYQVLITSDGYPSYAVNNLLNDCELEIMSLDKETIRKLTALKPYLTAAELPISGYLGVHEAKPTVGIKTVLAVYRDTDENKVYQIAHTLVNNYRILNASSPVLVTQSVEEAFAVNHVLPLHNGSRKIAKEIVTAERQNPNTMQNLQLPNNNASTAVKSNPSAINSVERHEEDDLIDSITNEAQNSNKQIIEKYNIDVSSEDKNPE